jgi:DNA (cytosine-5)-methyltransferase 3A
MIKLLIGGSPCTFWSIAQKNGRETEAEGLGWELFKNYLVAKEKFKPDLFLYENNKSAAQPIKDQIATELGVELMYINSALVSAQNRQRFYAFNWEVEQPQDRGIVLKDILESGTDLTANEKSYCLTASYGGACPWNTIERKQRTMVAVPIRVGTHPQKDGTVKQSQGYRVYSTEGKSVTISAQGGAVLTF